MTPSTRAFGVLDPGALRRTFLDLYGRPPLAEERKAWLGRPRADLVDQSLASEEFWANWLEEQLYFFLLVDNFRPTGDGIQGIPDELAAGRLGIREALRRICLSSSFDRRNPGADTFVTVVMEQIVGLVAQKNARELEIGKSLYDGAQGTFLGRSGGSQSDVVHIAFDDERFASHFIKREHERLLRRQPSPQDLSAWCALLVREDAAFRAILAEWFRSPAYLVRLESRLQQPNRLFIHSIFIDLLGRRPTEGELQRMRSALDGLADSTPLRSLVARMIVDSGNALVPERDAIPDPGAWIRELFERLLGRTPSASEVAAFLGSFANPACRPETVVYAIVSHPEYQTW